MICIIAGNLIKNLQHSPKDKLYFGELCTIENATSKYLIDFIGIDLKLHIKLLCGLNTIGHFINENYTSTKLGAYGFAWDIIKIIKVNNTYKYIGGINMRKDSEHIQNMCDGQIGIVYDIFQKKIITINIYSIKYLNIIKFT